MFCIALTRLKKYLCETNAFLFIKLIIIANPIPTYFLTLHLYMPNSTHAYTYRHINEVVWCPLFPNYSLAIYVEMHFEAEFWRED